MSFCAFIFSFCAKKRPCDKNSDVLPSKNPCEGSRFRITYSVRLIKRQNYHAANNAVKPGPLNVTLEQSLSPSRSILQCQ